MKSDYQLQLYYIKNCKIKIDKCDTICYYKCNKLIYQLQMISSIPNLGIVLIGNNHNVCWMKEE